MTNMSIKVTIIEDHKEYRESIFYILNSTDGFECVGQFESVESALKQMVQTDVVLLDIHLEGISGIDGITKIKDICPSCKIVMLTVFEDDTNIFRALLEGADGYILKKTPPTRLLQAIEDAASGGAPMTPSIAKITLDLFKDHLKPKKQPKILTPREEEILRLVVDGLSSNDIAEKLFISLQTVRNHIRHIYEKLHVHSKSQVVAKAIKEGFI